MLAHGHDPQSGDIVSYNHFVTCRISPMAVILEVLADFDGFAVEYDPDENPSFKCIIIENLRRLASVSAGKALLSGIATARPRSRGDFVPSVNVKCGPVHINYTQCGFSRETQDEATGKNSITGMKQSALAKYAPTGCPLMREHIAHAPKALACLGPAIPVHYCFSCGGGSSLRRA